MQKAQKLVKEFGSLIETTIRTSGKVQEYEEYAQKMSKYLREKFILYGLKANERRKVQKEWSRNNKEELKDRGLLIHILHCLWEEDKREMQAFGCDLAQEHRILLLGEQTEEHFNEAITCLQHLITNKSWWDTVDALSYPVVGYFVKSCPQWGIHVMDQWISHENMWLQRVALLHQLQYKEATDSERLFRYCLLRADEEEFFIRKAIGWALRQYGRTNREGVKKFVNKNKKLFSHLSVKEALKHIH